MKRCSTCGSTYTDDSLVYCLQDGGMLLKSETDATNPLNMVATLHDDSVHAHADPPPTQIMDFASAPTVQLPASSPTTLYQEPRPTIMSPGVAPTASQPPSNTTRTIAVTIIITLLVLGVGGAVAWMLLRGDSRVENTNGNRARAGETQTNNAGEPANQTANQTASAANSANASSKTGNARGANQPDKGGRWFVILGSYPKAETSKANERLDSVRRQGFDARIVSSDDYPNMKSGLLVVVMGPYTRNTAEETLQKVRPVITDAYTKSGW